MIFKHKILSLELQFIIACCNGRLTEFFIDYSEIISIGGIDQFEILCLCNRHQISPIVYHAIKGNNNAACIEMLNHLKDRVFHVQIKALAAKGFLQKLEEKINEHGIQMFLLKGISISRRYYGDLGMRDAMDVDLLIAENNLDKVVELFSEMGYSYSGGYNTYTPRQKAFIKYIDYHFGFSKEDGTQPLYLELHWALRNRFGNFILNPFLNCQGEIAHKTSPSTGLLELNDVDGFLFLCSHASEHAFYRLKWLVDVYMVHDKIEFDYKLLVDRSVELKCTEQLILSYRMLEHFFSVPLPEAIDEASKKHPISNWLINYCIQQVLYRGEYCDTLTEKIKNLRFSFIMNRKGILNKRLLKRYLTSPNDWKLVQLPDHLFFLYFILRPFLFIYRRLKR